MKAASSLVAVLLAMNSAAVVRSQEPAPFGPPSQADHNRPGPWDNDVLVFREGTNGAPKKLATFARAGVPTLARLKDGRILAAFQHFPEDDDRNFDRVAVRFSSDEGETWSKPEAIAVAGMEPGLARPFDPTLVPLPDGRIRLYFTSNRSPDFRRSTPAIYSAVASDGVHYTFERGVRFGLEGRVVIDCAAALHSGVFHLIVPDNGPAGEFMGGQQRREPPRAGTGYHAVSKDGLNFQRVADVQVPANRRWLGNLQSDGKRLVFFGTGDSGIWSATSADGKEWETDTRLWRLPGADPGVVKLSDGSWLLAVTGPPREGTAGAAAQLRRGAMAGEKEPFGQRPPAFGERTLPLPADRWVFTHIPSTVGGEPGIAVGVLFPRQSRYTNGAPVAIHVAGGVQAGGARGRPEYVGLGFVEIHFAFPGGGQGGNPPSRGRAIWPPAHLSRPQGHPLPLRGGEGKGEGAVTPTEVHEEERSGGDYDFRGPNCIRALADVIRFATGRITDKDGRRISELGGRIAVLTNNCGIVGSSHGGNACGMAMALHGREFADLAWYASMESPYGEGAANVELGGRDSGVNPAYDPKTGALDLSRLAWSPELSPGMLGKPMPVPTRALKGAFFFDLDRNGEFSAEQDFPANCFVGDDGKGVKAWYSPRVLAEAERRHLVTGQRPAHIPSLEQSQTFWRYRDAAPSIPEAVHNCTNLAVIVYANERDHVQAAPDHGHILIQVEGFRLAKARFVRLNPDRSYVERMIAGRPPFGPGRLADPARTQEALDWFPDNPAGKAFDRGNISSALEPARFPLGLYMQAAVCELADRTQAGRWAPNLDGVIFPEAPWQPLPGPLGRGAGPR